MEMNPYLFFDGRCEEAFRFYAECLNGKVLVSMRYGDGPGCEGMSVEGRNRIMHTTLALQDQLLQGSDCPPGRYEKPQGMSISVGLESPGEVDRVFEAFAVEGNVHMPLAETFWAARFGMVTDRFGIPWMIGCNKKEQTV